MFQGRWICDCKQNVKCGGKERRTISKNELSVIAAIKYAISEPDSICNYYPTFGYITGPMEITVSPCFR